MFTEVYNAKWYKQLLTTDVNAEIGTDGIIHNIDIAYNNGDSVSFFVLTILLQLLLSSNVSFKKGYIYTNIYIIILLITKRLSSCII